MKILIFVKTFANPTLTFVYNEILALSQKAEVLVITTERKNDQLFPFNNVVEIPFFKQNTYSKIQLKMQFNDFEFAFRNKNFGKRIQEVVEDFKPDVIHSHFGFESWLLLKNINISHIPIHVSFHGYDASHKLRSKRYLETLKKYLSLSYVKPIFVSKYMLANVMDKTGLDLKQKSDILYYGINCDFFKRVVIEEQKQKKIFLQISSFADKKGHFFTVNAFKKFLERKKNPEDFKLILAGDGHLLNSIKELVTSLKINSYVEFPGLVNKDGAKELMQKADYFVHHSVTSEPVGDMEGIPNALIEAMSMELPVISTYHSGIPELVENEVNGYLVKERDIDTYSQKMEEILTWNYLSINREKVFSQFEQNKHCEKLIRIYENSISNNFSNNR